MKAIDIPRLNPFPGLRPFRSDEHHLFFGREEQTAALLQLLRTNRFLAVVGTSGSGKSSLVRAGLIAELHGGTMTRAGSTWEVMILRPGGNPIENLARAFVAGDLYDTEDPSTLPRLLATLNRSRFGLVEAMKQSDLFTPLFAGEGPGARDTNLLVVVDQFEELFRFRQQGVDSEETAAAFVNLLLTASQQEECPIYVAITMRSDYLGDCSEIPGLAEAVNDGEYLIPRLLRDQKRDAIEKPIGVGGAKISPLLVQRLLNDVGDDPDQLPVLQHALMRMWEVWSAGSDHTRPIDFADFEATGGLASALSNHADEIYDSLPDNRHRAACEKIFKTLTEKGADNRGIRRPARLVNLQAIAAADRDTVTTVLDAFRCPGVTFLMPGAEVELDGRSVLDLSHESLMRGWQRLRTWVEDEAQSARIFRRLLDTARLWGDGKAGLFRDPDLQIALSWRAQVEPNSEWAEQYGGHFETAIGFLETSAAEAQAERQARDAARKRELDQARRLAEAQELRLEQQRRAAGRLRKMIAGVAVVAVIAGLACIAALVARHQAGSLAEIARQNEERATENAWLAAQSEQETKKVLAVVESQKAEVQDSLSKAKAAEQLAREAEKEGRKLLYTTDMRLVPFLWKDQRSTAEQLRVLLEKHVPPSSVQKSDLRGFEWRYYKHLLDQSAAVFSGHQVPVTGAAFTPENELVTLDQNGQIRHWDLDSRQEDAANRRDLPGGPATQFRALSANGRLAALAEADKVHVFDALTGKEAYQIDSANVPMRRMIFSRNGERLVIVDNKIRWCSAGGGEVIADLNQAFQQSPSWGGLALSDDGLTLAVVAHGPLGQIFSLFRLDPTAKTVSPLGRDISFGGTWNAAALSPDGQHFVVGALLSGTMFVFDTATRQGTALHGSAHASSISAMTFSRDGSSLATADAQGTIKVWADVQKLTSKSAPLLELKGRQGAITTVGFSNDGKRLVTTTTDKTCQVWDLENAGAAIRPLESLAVITSPALRFSPDGQLIAAGVDNSVSLFDAGTGRMVRSLSGGGKGFASSLAFSPTDSRLLAVGYGGEANVSYVVLWDIDAGTELARLPGATDLAGIQVDENVGVVGALAFSPDGKFLVAGFGTKHIYSPISSPIPLKVWDVATRRLVRRLSGHAGYCLSLDFSQDGTLLASGSRDGTAIVWSTSTWKANRTLQNPDKHTLNVNVVSGRPGMVEDVALSPDGKLLAMASREGNVHLWEVAGGKLLATLTGHSSAVNAVAFARDGRTLTSGGDDLAVRLWNVETRRELMQLDPGSVELGPVQALTFSPDGQALLAVGRSNSAVWSTAPLVWNDTAAAAEKLKWMLQSKADFQSRIRLLSENLQLHAALANLDASDVRVAAALAATQANWHASRHAWSEAVEAFDRLIAVDPTTPAAWLRAPGLLRLATALVHHDRPAAAIALLRAGAQRMAQDPAMLRSLGFGFRFVNEAGLVRIESLFPGSPAARAKLLPGDTIVKVNGVDTTRATTQEVVPLLAGGVGTKARLTVRHSGSTETADVEMVKANNIQDVPTATFFAQLQAELEARLTANPRDPTLLELRADLAGQELDVPRQIADYTAAISLLKEQTTGAAAAPALARLYHRRGDAYVKLHKWSAAVEDYARVVTDQTTDEELLANQALAQAEAQLVPHNWTVLKPAKMTSRGGATLTKLDDHSILAGGVNPPGDQYTLEFVVPERIEIQSIRLEALMHDSLPRHGPGRSAYFVNGIFALTNWDLTATGPEAAAAPRALGFRAAWADYSMNNAPLGLSGDWNTTFGEGADHTSVWSLLEPVTLEAGTVLRSRMRFNETAPWTDQNLGRFRLSVSSDSAAFDREPKRFAALKISDPWQKAATLYQLQGNQEAIDKLVERHPKSAGLIGDLFTPAMAVKPDWPRALAIYSRPIHEEPADNDLLAKRALAHEALQNWDAAAADWSLAATGNPDGAKLLAEFARRLISAGQAPLAHDHFKKSQALYERSLAADPENDMVVPELAQLLLEIHKQGDAGRWTVLKPVEAKSELGATLSILPDDSILVSGPDRVDDRYRVVMTVAADIELQAVRLEALTHPSLPGSGPGRYPGRGPANTYYKGTFGQTSWKVTATLPNRKEPIPLQFDQAWAEYHYMPITPQGAWNIAGGGEGRDCMAIWSMNVPVSLVPGTTLTFETQLKSFENIAENLGRFRLSISGDPATVDLERQRLAATQAGDPWLKLAAAYAASGLSDQALPYFSRALEQADGYEARKSIFELASRSDEVFSALGRRLAGDPLWQLGSARKLAKRGQQLLSDKRPAEALAELENSREIFARLLAPFPSTGWTVLTPIEVQSDNGAKMELQKDSSIFVHQQPPARNDSLSLVFQSELKGITGLRLEALADPRLPNGGPGWLIGEFELHEVTLQVAPMASPDQARAVALRNAWADFSEADLDVRGAVDGNASTGWGIYPEVNRDHTALFEMADRIGDGQAWRLTLRLTQGNAGLDNVFLGRFRLSIANAATTIPATQFRLDLKKSEIVDLYLGLANAHAQLGNTDKAANSYTAALRLTADRAGKAKIIAAAAPLKGVLEKLAERVPGDALFRAELTRHFAEQGQAELAEAARAKARAWFEKMLAQEPENAAWAEGLATLLHEIFQHERMNAARWIVLEPSDMRSESGAKLELQKDGSVFVQQQEPAKNDTYLLVFPSNLKGIAGLLLETLADSRLPKGGSGWGPDGNFVLNELTLYSATAGSPDQATAIALRNASADFSQLDFDVTGAVDGNGSSGWAVGPEVYKDHRAIFELGEQVGDGQASRLTVLIKHQFFVVGHNLGRFRLSVCRDRATLDQEQQRISALKFADPWAKLAAAYHLLGDQPALDKLLKHHPSAAAGIGDQ